MMQRGRLMRNSGIIISLCIFALCCVIAMVHIDNVCASDECHAGSGGIKVEDVESDLPDTHEEYVEYFAEAEEEAIIGEIEIVTYTEEELELLARVIFAEAGSNWCSDKMQQYTGSVVLNRMASPLFPNTMREVVYQRGQYSCARSGSINKTPNERAYNCARFLLEKGSVLPSNVVFQSQHRQGDGLYEQVQNMYFCYKN